MNGWELVWLITSHLSKPANCTGQAGDSSDFPMRGAQRIPISIIVHQHPTQRNTQFFLPFFLCFAGFLHHTEYTVLILSDKESNIVKIAKAGLHKLPGKSSLNVRSLCPVCPLWLVCPVCLLCPDCPVCPDDHDHGDHEDLDDHDEYDNQDVHELT